MTIPAADLSIKFVRSSGPGGQNVNKLATKAELRFQLDSCRALSEDQKRRLRARYPSHVTQAGEFVVVAEPYRSQARNEQAALARLREMLLQVQRPPKRRIATTVSAGARRRRLEGKRKRSTVKRLRSTRGFD